MRGDAGILRIFRDHIPRQHICHSLSFCPCRPHAISYLLTRWACTTSYVLIAGEAGVQTSAGQAYLYHARWHGFWESNIQGAGMGGDIWCLIRGQDTEDADTVILDVATSESIAAATQWMYTGATGEKTYYRLCLCPWKGRPWLCSPGLSGLESCELFSVNQNLCALYWPPPPLKPGPLRFGVLGRISSSGINCPSTVSTCATLLRRWDVCLNMEACI